MGRNGLHIDKDDQRRDRVLRKSLKVNTNNTIPERMSQPTPISIEMNNTPSRSLTDLPECPPRIHDKNNQGKDPNRKSDILYMNA
jgi:hypothetical protein